MKFNRGIPALALVLILPAIGWFWWNWPRRVDMAQYAPADALLYLECNNIANVVESITATDAWKELGPNVGLRGETRKDRWLIAAASVGIGPVESVILSRAQVAAIMLNLDASEENATLKIKPEGAVIIETHTSLWRMKPAMTAALQRFAERIYGQVTAKRYVEDAEYLEWSSLASDRKIVAAIDGSVVVVGNNKRAVQKCLEAHRGNQPSLRDDSTLRQMRAKLGAPQALAFGYVSSANASRLLSWGAPLLVGREPGDSNLEQILNRNAAKVLGSVGWSSRAASGGIEDRFLVSLEPNVVSRLRPAFRVGPTNDSFWKVVPDAIDSITVYRSDPPTAGWEALRAVYSQFDALSAVVIGSILKGALLPFGIENPQKFLNAVGAEVATLKVNQSPGGNVLLARAVNRSALEQMFEGTKAHHSNADGVFEFEIAGSSERKFAGAFIDEYLVLGTAEDVRACVAAQKMGQTIARTGTASDFTSEPSAGIVTYSNDTDRVRKFFSFITAVQGNSAPALSAPIEGKIKFATTETSLVDEGIDRRTKSALGLFSTLAGLLSAK